MKKKGFTLIELLAVIVILAIITLIAVPTILGVINKSRKEAALQSALGYIDAIEKQIIINETMNDNHLRDGQYHVKDIEVPYKGEKIKNGQVTIEKGIVTTSKLCINQYSVDYKQEKIEISSNNYCSNDYEITLDQNGTVEKKKIGLLNETEFSLSDINNMTNVNCNNGAVPRIENNTLKITNIYGNTTCKINDSLKETVDYLDTTENNTVMLNDETLSDPLIIKENNNVILDLNGKNITYQSKAFSILITNNGNLTINDSAKQGIVKTNFLVLRNTGDLTINNGNFVRENSASLSGGIISVIGGTTKINNGTFQTDKTYAIYSANSSNKAVVTINGGTIISDLQYSIVNKNPNCIFDINNIQITNAETSAIYNKDGIMNIKNSEISSTGKEATIQNVGSGMMNLTNNVIYSNENTVLKNDEDGNTNINGGTYASRTEYETIVNNSSGNINITDKNSKVYIANINEEPTTIYHPKAIKNNSSGNINIEGEKADNCDSTIGINSKGICIYSNYRTILNESAASGTINIDDIIIVSKQFIAVNNYIGYINILNSDIYSEMNVAVQNSNTGTINLCNSYISVTSYDIYNSLTGYIYYNSNTQLKNSLIYDTNDSSHIILNNTIMCK